MVELKIAAQNSMCVCIYLSRQLHNETSTAPNTKYIAACLGADPLIEITPD